MTIYLEACIKPKLSDFGLLKISIERIGEDKCLRNHIMFMR